MATKRIPQLHEILAVIPDTANAATAIMTETATTFTKKPDHFKGQTKSVKFLSEDRLGENTEDSKTLVTTVNEKLDHTFTIVGKHFDALLQQEEANQRAKADLILDGVVLGVNLPVAYLLGMEKRLKSLRDIMMHAPTLEPSVSWMVDAKAGANIFRSPAFTTMKTEKRVHYDIIVPPTDKFPAQVKERSSDDVVARVDTVHVSGMLSPVDKSNMLARMDNLISEVKQARQRANATELNDLHLAQKLFAYVMGV